MRIRYYMSKSMGRGRNVKAVGAKSFPFVGCPLACDPLRQLIYIHWYTGFFWCFAEEDLRHVIVCFRGVWECIGEMKNTEKAILGPAPVLPPDFILDPKPGRT